jgi:26S proteasome regulatory subunit N2
LLELKSQKKVEKAAAPVTLGDMRSEAFRQRRDILRPEEIFGIGSGAAAAAGVLTAVDEDEEWGEEAEMPRPFDYYSDEEEE